LIQGGGEIEEDCQEDKQVCCVLVSHACNPSYSGGRDQEDRGLPSLGKQLARPYLEKKKKTITKTG
jgi:hypothetical protein